VVIVIWMLFVGYLLQDGSNYISMSNIYNKKKTPFALMCSRITALIKQKEGVQRGDIKRLSHTKWHNKFKEEKHDKVKHCKHFDIS